MSRRGHSIHAFTVVSLAFCLFLSFAAPAEGRETGDPSRTACLVLPRVADPEGADPFLAALQIESRKREGSWHWQRAEHDSDCPEGQPILSLADPLRGTLQRPELPARSFELGGTPPSARPRTLARAVLAVLAPVAAEAWLPLLDTRDAMVLSREADPPPGSVPQDAKPWMVRVSGAYLYQFASDRHLGGVTLELGYSLYQGHLAFSLAGSYAGSPEIAWRDDIRVTHHCPEVLAMVRGGFRFDTIHLRAGLGAGWQRHILSVESLFRDRSGMVTRAWTTSTDEGVIAGDLELLWNFADRWNLGLLFNGRVYLGGAGFLDLGTERYGMPSGAVGAQLVLGVKL